MNKSAFDINNESQNNMKPLYISWAKDISEISGEFKIIPLQQGVWPERLKEIFGNPLEQPFPYNPFYYSYDATK